MKNLGNKGDTSAIVLAIIAGAIIIAAAIWLGFYYQSKIFQTKGVNLEKPVKTTQGKTSDSSGKTFGTGNNGAEEESVHQSSSESNNVHQAQAPTKSDRDLLRQALLDKTGINPSDFMFDIADNNGTIARGTVKDKNDISGAGWFAHKSNGVWTITYVGQGVPKCSEVNPYGYPVSWADYCLNSQGKPVHR